MIRRLGARLERLFRAATPDPFVLAILLTALTGALALLKTSGDLPAVVAAWQSPKGFWGLLEFAMQMCLVLVTGHALASAPAVRTVIAKLVDLPRSPGGAGALVAAVSVATSFLNWGLALIVGALLAREMGRSCQRRGIRVHYPLLVAAGYTGLMTWHGGFSGSAPLKVTTAADLAKMLPEALAARTAPISLFETILSPLNLVVAAGLLLGVPLLVWALTPGAADDVSGFGKFEVARDAPASAPAPATTLSERLEVSPLVTATLAVPLAVALFLYFRANGVARLDPNAVNLTLLTVGLVAHRTPRAYGEAVAEGVRGCAGIILQFPLYGGILGMMVGTGLAKTLAGWAAATGSESGYLVLTFFSAGALNLFVPSGGGQWAVQGPIALEAATQLGVPLGSAVMAVAYGDQWTNMLQPFWALPLLGITGVRARDIMGYTATIMLVSGLWFVTGLVVLG